MVFMRPRFGLLNLFSVECSNHGEITLKIFIKNYNVYILVNSIQFVVLL